MTTTGTQAHDGRSYVIVGGTTGMGHAAASLLAEAGARVCVIGRNSDRAEAVAGKIAGNHAVIGEGSDQSGVDGAVERAIGKLGGIDGLAVTAGPIRVREAFLALSDMDWAESFDTQLMTGVRAIRAALPTMIEQRHGAILTTAAYSIRAQKQPLAHYAAMKSAVASVTKNIAKHYGTFGIRANCIAPGAFSTEALDSARQQISENGDPVDDTELWKVMRDQWGMAAGLDRIGRPHEAGELIAFLLSDNAAYLTGALINIDGGTDF